MVQVSNRSDENSGLGRHYEEWAFLKGQTKYKLVLAIILEWIATERYRLAQNVATLNPHYNYVYLRIYLDLENSKHSLSMSEFDTLKGRGFATSDFVSLLLLKCWPLYIQLSTWMCWIRLMLRSLETFDLALHMNGQRCKQSTNCSH